MSGQRLIPTHAGKTVPRGPRRSASRAHPRSREENYAGASDVLRRNGSSPLTRGKQQSVQRKLQQQRLIPAHAGKTLSNVATTSVGRAHPRSRGENTRRSALQSVAGGSSPLTRGKHMAEYAFRVDGRLIPAHAEKTTRSNRSMRMRRAHPRSRGENATSSTAALIAYGSSPLTRGKRWCRALAARVGRLIPAHAGKTCGVMACLGSLTAHPRSRGENESEYGLDPMDSGSSPLTRGKHDVSIEALLQSGLIPAHAGKTRTGLLPPPAGPAHPRSRGENDLSAVTDEHLLGSSPLTRGKLLRLLGARG